MSNHTYQLNDQDLPYQLINFAVREHRVYLLMEKYSDNEDETVGFVRLTLDLKTREIIEEQELNNFNLDFDEHSIFPAYTISIESYYWLIQRGLAPFFKEDDTENDVQYFLLDPLTLEEIPVPTDELDDPIWNAFMYQDQLYLHQVDAALYSDDQELTAQSKQILYSYQISNNEMTTLFTDRLLNHTPLSTQLRDDKPFIISQTEDFEAEINLFQANNQDHVYQGIIHHPKPDMAFITPVF